MLKKDEETQKFFKGELNHRKTFGDNNKDKETGTVQIWVDSVFHFSENRLYLNWAMTKIGFGEIELSYEDGVWNICNEEMNSERCGRILATFEEGVVKSNNEELNETLKSLKKNLIVDNQVDTIEVFDLEITSLENIFNYAWTDMVKN